MFLVRFALKNPYAVLAITIGLCLLSLGEVGFRRNRLLVKHAAHGCGPKIQACPGQSLGDPLLPHNWIENLEALHDIADKVRILVHGLGRLEQGILLDFEPCHPRGDRLRLDLEGPGCFSDGPASGRLQLQDSHPIRWRVPRPLPGVHLASASIFDPDFLLEQRNFTFGGAQLAG